LSTQQLAVLQQRPAASGADPTAEHLRAVRRVKQLSWLSLVWMGAEGTVAIVAGVLAGSIALIGFGIDSAIEGFASAIIVWRFTGSRIHSQKAERRAQKLVAAQFFLLAPYVAFEAVHRLVTGERPDVSWLGMALATSSVIGMPLLGIAKVRLADRLGSAATRGEGNQNLLCAYLAGAVLIGLAGNAAFGAWWLDPAAALVIAAVAVREGIETWRGEGCCAAPELAPDAQTCDNDCCRSTRATAHTVAGPAPAPRASARLLRKR
jgi:divalent metal cation (Fe/Co/Zn/Cd) transporter